MKVAIVQLTAAPDKAENLRKIELFVEQAAEEGVRLVLFPELVMYDPMTFDAATAETLDGLFVSELSRIASANNVALIAGVFEVSPDPSRPYNTEVALGPDGNQLAVYRKVHLFDALGFCESDKILPGSVEENCGVVFEYENWRFGIVTCFDLRFPELVRTLADAGADVILHPTAWTSGAFKQPQHQVFCRARAVENTSYVLSANQTPPTFTGESVIVDPMGSIIAGLTDVDGVAVATLSRERLEAVRRELPLLELRRLPRQLPIAR